MHRLDKDTSGLMVVAKNDRAHQLADQTIRRPRPHRRHAARLSRVCLGRARTGSAAPVDAPIDRHPQRGKKWRCARAAARRSRIGRSGRLLRAATASRWRRCSPASSRPAAPTRSGSIWPISATRCSAMRSMARTSRPRRASSAPKARRRWPPSAAKRCTHTSWYWNTPKPGKFWSGSRICPMISLRLRDCLRAAL